MQPGAAGLCDRLRRSRAHGARAGAVHGGGARGVPGGGDAGGGRLERAGRGEQHGVGVRGKAPGDGKGDVGAAVRRRRRLHANDRRIKCFTPSIERYERHFRASF